MESRVYKAPTSRVGVAEQQKWCWKWRSSETVYEGRMRRVVSSCDIWAAVGHPGQDAREAIRHGRLNREGEVKCRKIWVTSSNKRAIRAELWMLPEEGCEGDDGRISIVESCKSPKNRQTRCEETTQVEVFWKSQKYEGEWKQLLNLNVGKWLISL